MVVVAVAAVMVVVAASCVEVAIVLHWRWGSIVDTTRGWRSGHVNGDSKSDRFSNNNDGEGGDDRSNERQGKIRRKNEGFWDFFFNEFSLGGIITR